MVAGWRWHPPPPPPRWPRMGGGRGGAEGRDGHGGRDAGRGPDTTAVAGGGRRGGSAWRSQPCRWFNSPRQSTPPILFFPLGHASLRNTGERACVRRLAGSLADGWMSRVEVETEERQRSTPTAGKRMESSRGILKPRWSSSFAASSAPAWPPLLLLSYFLIPSSLDSGGFCGGPSPVAIEMNKLKEVRSPL